jgi:hypothetical protein
MTNIKIIDSYLGLHTYEYMNKSHFEDKQKIGLDMYG